MSSRTLFWAAAIGLAAVTSSVSQAAITLTNGQSVQLSTVLASADHQVLIGDKAFTFNSYTSVQFPATSVFVTGFIAPVPNDGIGFDITGGFGDTQPGDATTARFTLGYTVDIQASFLAQGYRLKDIGLAFNGSSNGAGSFARVDETVMNGATTLATLAANNIFGQTAVLQDYRDFSPANYTQFTVSKDVKFFAAGASDSASASFVRQTFSQTIVPAPGSAALLGLGGLVAVRRRRR